LNIVSLPFSFLTVCHFSIRKIVSFRPPRQQQQIFYAFMLAFWLAMFFSRNRFASFVVRDSLASSDTAAEAGAAAC